MSVTVKILSLWENFYAWAELLQGFCGLNPPKTIKFSISFNRKTIQRLANQ